MNIVDISKSYVSKTFLSASLAASVLASPFSLESSADQLNPPSLPYIYSYSSKVTPTNQLTVFRVGNLKPDKTYFIQKTSDLTNWSTISRPYITNLSDTKITVPETNNIARKHQFYRITDTP